MPPADATKPRLLILYGSQTGNAQARQHLHSRLCLDSACAAA
jgi:hypothetical protein